MMRLRIDYAKTAAMRYTSNLDVHKSWERTLRRARLPLAYSQGFHPQPRIHQASPLPLGLISQAEVIDIWLEEELPLDEIRARLIQAAPPGIEIQSIQPVELQEPNLQSQVLAAQYVVTFLDPIPLAPLEEGIQRLLCASSLPRERRDRKYDLRPLIEKLEILPATPDGRVQVGIQLASRPNATGRPDEVLAELGFQDYPQRIERVALVFEHPAETGVYR